MRHYYTYLHCKPDGTPFYVGKGCDGKRKRGRSHSLFPSVRNEFHRRVVTKYGEDNIGIFVFPCQSEEEAFADEQRWISQLRREGYALTNATEGGEGAKGVPCSDITRAKIAEKHRGKRHSTETRAKMSLARIGNKNRLGKPHSPEVRLKISIGNKGVKRSPETRARMSASLVGNCNGKRKDFTRA